jgi:hypothetical protein
MRDRTLSPLTPDLAVGAAAAQARCDARPPSTLRTWTSSHRLESFTAWESLALVGRLQLEPPAGGSRSSRSGPGIVRYPHRRNLAGRLYRRP